MNKIQLCLLVLILTIGLTLAKISEPIQPLLNTIISEWWHGNLESLKNKIDFGVYFTSNMDFMEQDSGIVKSKLDLTDKIDSNTIKLLHLGKFKQAIETINKKNLSELSEQELLTAGTAPFMLAIYKKDFSQLPNTSRYLNKLSTSKNNRGLANWLLKIEKYLQTPEHNLNDINERIPKKVNQLFPTTEKIVKFLSRTTHVLPSLPATASKGVAIEDFNGDLYPDLVIASSYGPLRLLINQSGEKFVDHTVGSGLESITQAYTVSVADINNDGFLDLFVARPFHHFQILLGNNKAQFRDVTKSSGLLKSFSTENFYGTWNSCWSDIDQDGDLDLFIAQWGEVLVGTKNTLNKKAQASSLWLNNSTQDKVSFVNVSDKYGLTPYLKYQTVVACSFGDYNDDKLPDLVLSRFNRDGIVLLKNTGKSFVREETVVRNAPGFTVSFLDANYDTQLDIFQAGHGQAKTIFNNIYSKSSTKDSNSVILEQKHADQFKPKPNFFHPESALNSLGTTYGDINNDGCYDYFIGTGNPEPWFIAPNFLYLGNKQQGKCLPEARRRFLDISKTDQLLKLQGVSFFDYNLDGKQDLFTACGGFWESESCDNMLFKNTAPTKNNWLKIRLKGKLANHFGVGAKLKIKHKEKIIAVKHMSSKTGFGSSPYILHFGLDKLSDKITAEVTWPSSSDMTVHKLDPNKFYLLTETGTQKIL